MSSRVAVFGAGYAGLVTGACFAELGHSVVVRDVVPEKIASLQAGSVPFYEPGLEELVHRNGDRLRFTLDAGVAVRDAQFVFICVDTPPTYAGDADLSRVWTVIEELPPLSERIILVMKSTVPVGTGEKVRSALRARGLDGVGYASNPEFLAEGTAVRDFLQPDRIVVGAFEEADSVAVEELHAGLDAPIVRTDVASAEMIKLASNAFLGTRISFINEIANVCELVGADVMDVARGMGLDRRIGTRYLRPGIGFGGSCLVGEETVLVRDARGVRLRSLEALFETVAPEGGAVANPRGLEVLAWRPNAAAPEFLPVAAVTRRFYEGEIVDIRTKMGRRVRCTPDHPFLAADDSGEIETRLGDDLRGGEWLPLALGQPASLSGESVHLDVLAGLAAAECSTDDVIVRPVRNELAAIGTRGVRDAIRTLDHPRGAALRAHEIVRSGAMRYREAEAVAVSVDLAGFGTAKNGTHVPAQIKADEAFWRIVGLYIAEGHCARDGRRVPLVWSFHPRNELDLVEEVLRFWRLKEIKTTLRFSETAANVSISSRILAGWWLGVLGLGRNSYEQRVPDLIWSAPASHKRALLAGLWRGDGSWSYVAGGPSVVLEYGTVSRELADGILRLLGELGIVARLKVGRTKKSTRDTYWLVISGAAQVEQILDFVRPADVRLIRESIGRQAKRIAPTGYRPEGGTAWLRVVNTSRRPFLGSVYSLEVPGAHTFVTTGGLVTHNCFPKDISFLKLLAGNSGYHFQLLNSVIEVNELQKRSVIGKLQKHLGTLRGKTVALLGLAFKANTDDLREAPSIVLASRLLAEGADVRAWDPVADASEVLKGVSFHDTVLEAVHDADAAVIVTEWEQLRSLASREIRTAMRNPLIIDGRNLLDPVEVRAAGFTYEGIGRLTSPLDMLPETDEPESPLTEHSSAREE